MVITCTQRELIVIDILRTHTPLDFLQLLLETSGRIAKALEYATNRTHITVLATDPILIVAVRLSLILSRHSRHQQLVCIGSNRETVILVNRYHQRGTQTHVCWQELTLVITIEGDFTTDIREVETNTQLALTAAHDHIVIVVHGQICSKG